MSAKERRIRRQRHPEAHPSPVASQETPAVQRALLPLPQWKWRTFPVFFALSFGMFIGVYMGWFAGYIAADTGNQTMTTVVFIIAAIFLGASLSRLTTRFMLSRNWIKPRPRK